MYNRFWITFEGLKNGDLLILGCGVTAVDENDAINIIRAKIFKDDQFVIKSIISNISIEDLEPNHVRPNIGDIFPRGVWFPQGYN